MNSQYYPQGRSPPPLQHPIPTHAHYQIPEPPDTPVSDQTTQGYMRFTSPPVQGNMSSSQGVIPMQMSGMGYGQPAPPVPPHQQQQPYGAYAPPPQSSFQSFGGPNGMPNMGQYDATAQIGMQLGKNAMAAGQDYVQKNFGMHFLPISSLKHQFMVSNSYVLNKLRIVLFPWRHRPWSRKVRRSETNGQSEGYQAPRDDINSPDLYIPTMAFVTYVLTATLAAGLDKRFRPEVLGVAASKALAVLTMDIAFFKLGCYLLNIQGSVQMVELAAYGGYKFVGTIVTMMAGMLLGSKLYWCVFLYCFGATGFFLLRSLRYVVLPDANSNVGNSTVTHVQRGWRVRFLFAVAVTQILYMAILALM